MPVARTSHDVVGVTLAVSTNVTMLDVEEEAAGGVEEDELCAPGKHRWQHEQCMICVLCEQCTGYGGTCVNSGTGNRNPGQ